MNKYKQKFNYTAVKTCLEIITYKPCKVQIYFEAMTKIQFDGTGLRPEAMDYIREF